MRITDESIPVEARSRYVWNQVCVRYPAMRDASPDLVLPSDLLSGVQPYIAFSSSGSWTLRP